MPILAVAPHWGAWIEIPVRERGQRLIFRSHPTGVRGLKLRHIVGTFEHDAVAPHWGAWIEMDCRQTSADYSVQSHPTGVRGLKFVVELLGVDGVGRTPLGCVD